MITDFPDPYIPQWIEHGVKRLRTERPRLQSRSREIDTVSVSYQDDRSDVYPIDSYVDGYPTMPIVERDARPDGPVYQYRLQLEGLKTGVWRELNYEEDLPEESWDTINVTVYTRDPAHPRWRKGAQVQGEMPLYDVSADSSTSKLAYAEHGLITGQIALVEFSEGFGGLTSGGTYYACRLNANQFYFAANKDLALVAGITPPAAPVSITGVAGTTHRILRTAHGFTNGTVLTFPTLTGGGGLVAATKPYFVVNATADDFQVALTAGGSAVPFNTDIAAGTCQKGSAILITSDGTGMTLSYVKPGFELCWITERRKRIARAKGYWEIDLQYKGLKCEDDDSKPVKRRMSTTAQTVTHDKFPGAIVSSVYAGFPPEVIGTTSLLPPIPPGYMPVELDLPQIAATDVFVSDQPPPTWLVPGCWIPHNAPAITIITTGSDAYTYYWPSGWKVLSMQVEQIPGKNLWLYSITWGYQISRSPRTAPTE